MEEPKQLKIPGGIAPGNQNAHIKNHGFPRMGSKEKGDLLRQKST